jgi:hypothetical protein
MRAVRGGGWHHVAMDYVAAGIVATVDASLLIALTVDANSQKKDANSQEKETEPGRDEASDSYRPLHGIMEWLYGKGKLRQIMAWLYEAYSKLSLKKYSPTAAL